MDEVVDCSENGKSDCNWRNVVRGQECCNGKYCCSPEIFNQLKALPCVDQNGCRTLGYGNFWFPAKEEISESSPCCDDYPSWIRLLYHLRTGFKSQFVVQTLFFCCVSIWPDVIHYHPFSKSESEITETCLCLLFLCHLSDVTTSYGEYPNIRKSSL